ncbi:hypothetical protein VP489E541_P0050 [Vibrio phage 489E54-1]|nr:hypothetical protein VP489E541_P0050 [Vibrio phage 489E54-1]
MTPYNIQVISTVTAELHNLRGESMGSNQEQLVKPTLLVN